MQSVCEVAWCLLGQQMARTHPKGSLLWLVHLAITLVKSSKRWTKTGFRINKTYSPGGRSVSTTLDWLFGRHWNAVYKLTIILIIAPFLILIKLNKITVTNNKIKFWLHLISIDQLEYFIRKLLFLLVAITLCKMVVIWLFVNNAV